MVLEGTPTIRIPRRPQLDLARVGGPPGRKAPSPGHASRGRGPGGACNPISATPHSQVNVLEAENQKKSREVSQLQARGAQEQQQGRREALHLQRRASEAEAALEAARKEVGRPRGPGRRQRRWRGPGMEGRPAQLSSAGTAWGRPLVSCPTSRGDCVPPGRRDRAAEGTNAVKVGFSCFRKGRLRPGDVRVLSQGTGPP